MKLAVICAMEEELAKILLNVPLVKIDELVKAGNLYTRYSFNQHEVICVTSGIGKVNAALTTQILLDLFKPDIVINFGVAGSLTTNLGFGDVVVATDLIEHDVDTTAFGIPLGQIPRMECFSFKAAEKIVELLSKLELKQNRVAAGRIISGDQFIADKAKAEFLHKEFSALACEMEGAAIAHVCYLNQVPFAVIRSLSDMAGQVGEAAHTYNKLKEMAAHNAALGVKSLLESEIF